jgi:hypothetical protein
VTIRICLCAVGLLLAGCGEKSAPTARIGHYLRSERSVAKLHRVVFVSLGDSGCDPQITAGMNNSLLDAIQDRQLFHVDLVPRAEPACEELPLDTRKAYSMEQLAEIRDALDCDAVFLGKIKRFETYPRMKIGIYLRLLDLKDGKLLWAVDNTWDTTDGETEKRIEWFFKENMRSGYDPLQWRLTIMSPKLFAKFVAYETANTLPMGPIIADGPDPEEGEADSEWSQASEKLKKGAKKVLKTSLNVAKMTLNK